MDISRFCVPVIEIVISGSPDSVPGFWYDCSPVRQNLTCEPDLVGFGSHISDLVWDSKNFDLP